MRIVGVEREAEVVADCREVAERMGLDEISFHRSEISEFDHEDLWIWPCRCTPAIRRPTSPGPRGWFGRRASFWRCRVASTSSPVTGDRRLGGGHRHGILHERFWGAGDRCAAGRGPGGVRVPDAGCRVH
ncbi:MAG: hypothetical protein Ct9H300mP1_00320 [Planctomycetaceae bacterium]|nr:MAG: hypothetical protein Ct9H300mP1_00320 [Planctomycetaceae bacterium]